jgi:hypothetical protein
VDIGGSLTYMFDDERWASKLLIGGILNLVPLAGLAAVGYQLRVMRNVASGIRRPLPEWRDPADLALKGILVALAGLLYAIPGMLVGALSLVLSIAAGASAASGDGEALGAVLVTLAGGGVVTALLYGLLLSLWLPEATLNYALAGDLAAFFRFREIWDRISRHTSDYVVALVVVWLASLAAGVIGGALLLVGAAFTSFWAMLVFAHVLGRLEEPGQQVALTRV